MKAEIDESNPHYQRFVECFMEGASLQDIYSQSHHGYAVNARADSADPAVRERRMHSCRTQFLRIFEHLRNIVEPVEQHVALRGKRVLDFGCGTGALSVALALRGADVVGVDPTPISLEASLWRARYFGCEDRFEPVVVGTDPGLPLADCAFDLVILNSVMEFIPHNRDRYVLDLLRLLKPGGHLVISTENGLFPVDYYTRRFLPLFRRKTMISKNLPYGATYFELRTWIRNSPRKVEDLSVLNRFNSIDKFAARQQDAGRAMTASLIRSINSFVKTSCRIAGVPSDVFLPYAIYVFRVAA